MSNNIDERYNLDNFEASFRNYLISEQVSPVTLKNYLSDIRHFLGWFSLFVEVKDSRELHVTGQNTIALFLDNEAVEQYKTYLLENKLPEKTVNRRLSSLRKFCTFAISQGWLKENVAKNVGNVGGSVIANASMSLRGGTTKQSRDQQNQILSHINGIATPRHGGARDDMIEEFKKDLLSQQADPARRDMPWHVSTENVDRVLDDIHEFLAFIN